MTVGRKPKPDAIKDLHGSRRKRNPAEPQFARGRMPAPSFLLPDAKTEWRRVIRDMTDSGVVTRMDRSTLAAYCQLYARWTRAEQLLAERGPLIKTLNGNVIQSPLVGMANRAMELMLRAAVELGMTPSARVRVHAETAPTLSMADLLFAEVAELAEATDGGSQ